jgi:HEAT repeat protein
MLLARHETLGGDRLLVLLADDDPSVRRAALEAVGVRRERAALPGVLGLLRDPTMYVRAHACRAAGRLGGAEIADRIVPLLGDREWWVRAAAKDTLRSFGPDALDALLPVLRAEDRFARNGAAEILQDIGVLDRLAHLWPGAPIVEQIYAAGEDGMRRAAVRRQAGGQHQTEADVSDAA